MARIMGIDYGKKKTGISVTDNLQIAVHGLTTVETPKLKAFLEDYFNNENVIEVVIGEPLHPDGNPFPITLIIYKFVKYLEVKYPKIKVTLHDESHTSQRAKEIIFESGASKKKRRDKSLVDKIAAILILQDYLKH